MQTLTELRRKTGDVVRPVIHAGKTVRISEHGKPVLRIVPDAERRLVSIAELKAAPISEDAIADAVEAARAAQ